MANIFQIRNIVNSQTKNTNRATIKFYGLDELVDRAKNSRLSGVQRRYEAVKNVIKHPNVDTFAKTLELSLLSVVVPNVQVETQMIHRFNDMVRATTKFAEMDDMTVTFYDYVNGSSSALMFLWQALVADKETGAFGFKEDFILRRAELLIFGPDAPGYPEDELDDRYLEKHQIVNIFPKNVNLGEHNYETGEARRVEINFSIDNIFPTDYRGYNAENQVIQ